MISLAFIAISIGAKAQTKDTFCLKSFPNYDEFGNYYEVTKSFDHVPTSQDTLDFKRESDKQIDLMMEQVKRENNYYPPTPVPVKKTAKKKN